MAPMPVQRASDGAAFVGRTARGGVHLLLTVPLLLLAALLVAPVHSLEPLLAAGVGAQDASPAQLISAAAAALESATGPGGAGISFEVVQRQTIYARADGPLIEIPDPADPGKTLGTTDHYEIGTLVERGSATADSFSMEILAGPLPGRVVDYDADKAEIRRRALVRDGVAWRDDGTGWYVTDELPGIGLDPVTVESLPRLLRAATDATDRALTPPPDGLFDLPGLKGPATEPVRALGGSARVADIPAVIAADGAAFSEITNPADYRFDDAGRLVGLTVVARNTNMTTYDLMIETVYAFSYPDRPPKLPDPVPTMAPTPAPRVEG